MPDDDGPPDFIVVSTRAYRLLIAEAAAEAMRDLTPGWADLNWRRRKRIERRARARALAELPVVTLPQAPDLAPRAIHTPYP